MVVPIYIELRLPYSDSIRDEVTIRKFNTTHNKSIKLLTLNKLRQEYVHMKHYSELEYLKHPLSLQKRQPIEKLRYNRVTQDKTRICETRIIIIDMNFS